MGDRESFITRWSRRKREAESDESPASTNPADAETGGGEAGAAEAAAAAPADAEPVDIESLPPIESITAETDIRAFLRAGVPAALKQAALRRAWAADPAIRDFVGLADYDWDFNAPNSMPGFGPLQPTDALRKLVSDSMTGAKRMAEETPPAEGAKDRAAAERRADQPGRADDAQESEPSTGAKAAQTAKAPADDFAEAPQVKDGEENMNDKVDIKKRADRRGHGGALPQ